MVCVSQALKGQGWGWLEEGMGKEEKKEEERRRRRRGGGGEEEEEEKEVESLGVEWSVYQQQCEIVIATVHNRI